MVKEICPELFLIEIPLPNSPLKYLNSYVIRSKDRNLIIDTGLNNDVCMAAMEEGLASLDIDLNKTDFFITHLHADHFGLVSRLTTEDSKTFFNRPDAEIIEAKGWWKPMLRSAERNGFPKEELLKALEKHPGYKDSSDWIPHLSILNDGDEIRVGDYCFTCVHTPGHTLGHTCLYEADKKLLVAGDHILIDITPNIQCWYDDDRNPLGYYLESLAKVSGMDIDLVLPGHRRLVRDPQTRINELISHHEERCLEIKTILAADRAGMNAYTMASKMTWDIRADSWEDFPVAQKWFATGEAIAHLRFLEEKGEIHRLPGQETIRYTG